MISSCSSYFSMSKFLALTLTISFATRLCHMMNIYILLWASSIKINIDLLHYHQHFSVNINTLQFLILIGCYVLEFENRVLGFDTHPTSEDSHHLFYLVHSCFSPQRFDCSLFNALLLLSTSVYWTHRSFSSSYPTLHM